MTGRKRSGTPRLNFSPGDMSGFTSAGLAGFSDLNPTAIVRELLQNSLDAGREADIKPSVVRFEIKQYSVDKIPGIESYKDAFNRAVDSQKKAQNGMLPDQANGVVNAISNCLKKKKCQVLFVLDNGIGLNNKRMTALLSDGFSVKENVGTGAVGNGHLTVLPASDLRYVLYGGLVSGMMTGSGHAVLASFESQEKKRTSKDGYFTIENREDLYEPFVFPKNEQVPDFISKKLLWIKNEWKRESGTVVIVPGFNNFREDGNSSLWDMISKAAACNFFAAIHQGEIRIELAKDQGEPLALDEKNIYDFLSKFESEKRTSSKFLSGSRAFEAYKTIIDGKEMLLDTGIGKITVKLRTLPENGRSRIDLCRNGMWITSKLPRLDVNKFSEHAPFHCLVMLKAEDGDEIHRLVRKSEGPLHNHLDAKKWLDNSEKRDLEQAMSKISDALTDSVPKLDHKTFSIQDILSIDSHGIAQGGRRLASAGAFEEFRRVPRRNDEGKDENEDGPGPDKKGRGKGGKNGNGGGGRGTFRKSGSGVPFGAIFVPKGQRSYSVDLKPENKVPESEIRFILDENLDNSCDDSRSEGFVSLKNVKLNGKDVSGKRLMRDENDRVLGIRLGALSLGQNLRLDFDFVLPQDIEVSGFSTVALKAELIRRAATSINKNDNV
ncbi:MAG: hypothetical protein OXC39_04195 [Candidatus Dadabacteria bacterium]|nr:hypothetical protein [Candidatus Dadabacteria bacterium]